jgi:hypothetical protein
MPLLEPLIQITIATGLALLFAVAVIHKIRDWEHFRTTLANYRLAPAVVTPALAAVIVVVEAIIVIGCIAPASRGTAVLLASALLLVYAAAMATNLLRGRAMVDCGCGGFGQRQPLEWWMVRRNVLLAAIGLLAALPITPRLLTFADLFVVTCATASVAGLYLAHATLAGNRRHARR